MSNLPTLFLLARLVVLTIRATARDCAERWHLSGRSLSNSRQTGQSATKSRQPTAESAQPTHAGHTFGELLHHQLHLSELGQQLVDLGG